MSTIAERITLIQARMLAATQRMGRPATAVRLIAVTKMHAPEAVMAAVAAGVTALGENRVQEAEAKIAALAGAGPALQWHLIGPLQRNKARRAVALFDLIHSLDSVRLGETLAQHVADDAPERRLAVLLQVSLAGEAQKAGFALEGGLHSAALPAFYAEIEALLALPHLDVRGLMTVPPAAPNPEDSRPYFRQLRRLRDELARRYPQSAWSELSMGMSNDYEAAIEEGATLVRIGSAIFGAR